MASRYPAQIDSSSNLPTIVDNFTPVSAVAVNNLRDAIINVQTELGIKPSGTSGTLKSRLDQSDILVAGAVTDSLTALTAVNNILANGVDKINGATVPIAGSLVVGTVLRVIGTSALDYGAVDLANVSAVTGILPAINQANQTLGLDLSGTTDAAAVEALTGNSNIVIIRSTAKILQWEASTVTPTITQADKTIASDTGESLIIHAQNETGTTSTGGAIILQSGTGTSADGYISMYTGSNVRFTVNATGIITITNLGTGIVHADSSGNLTSSEIVNADVSATAAIVGTKITPNFGSQAITTSSSLSANDISATTTISGNALSATTSLTAATADITTSVEIGTTPSTTGTIRLASGFSIESRDNGDTANLTALTSNASDELFLGTDSSYTSAFQYANVRIYPSGSVLLGKGSTTYAQLGAAASDFIALGATPATTGFIRIPYNGGSAVPIIVGKAADTSDNAFLTYGSGNQWYIGATTYTHNIFLNAISIQNVANGGTYTNYHTGGFDVYNYTNAAYDYRINSTGFNLVTKPGGRAADKKNIGLRLTLTTGTPVTTSDVTAASTLYLTPYLSQQIALFDGTDWWEYQTTEISLSLSSLTSGKNYDVFAYWTGSVVALELSAAWSTDTARTDALTTQDGVLVKSGVTTRRYLGTIRTTSTTTTEDSYAKRFVWNYYNRTRRPMKVIESANSWTYSGVARPYNNNTANAIAYVCGEIIHVHASARGMAFYTAANWGAAVDIGVDSTSTGSAITKTGGYTLASAYNWPEAEYHGAPGLGYHNLTMLERSGNSVNFYGDNNDPTYFQAGIIGTVFG